MKITRKIAKSYLEFIGKNIKSVHDIQPTISFLEDEDDDSYIGITHTEYDRRMKGSFDFIKVRKEVIEEWYKNSMREKKLKKIII